MSNEEILDYLKNDDYSPVFADEGWDDTPYKLFDETEVKLLLDYITNLQQENERLKELIKDNTIQVQDENGNYQECNINVIKMYNDMQDDIENLIKEKDDYKSRNEKAISLLCDIDSFIMKRKYTLANKLVKHTKNILNGGQDE